VILGEWPVKPRMVRYGQLVYGDVPLLRTNEVKFSADQSSALESYNSLDTTILGIYHAV